MDSAKLLLRNLFTTPPTGIVRPRAHTTPSLFSLLIFANLGSASIVYLTVESLCVRVSPGSYIHFRFFNKLFRWALRVLIIFFMGWGSAGGCGEGKVQSLGDAASCWIRHKWLGRGFSRTFFSFHACTIRL